MTRSLPRACWFPLCRNRTPEFRSAGSRAKGAPCDISSACSTAASSLATLAVPWLLLVPLRKTSATCQKFLPDDATWSREQSACARLMKALVKRELVDRAFGWRRSLPLVGEFDVLVRILRSSICGTDVHIYEWNSWAQRTIPTPMTIGHEFVGIIESVEIMSSISSPV